MDGGFNGSAGVGTNVYPGGKGSGIDVRTLNMTRFALTPGKAGKGEDEYGGGGGGILVNGEKPSGSGDKWEAEGFGAGWGETEKAGKGTGHPGCILIEFSERQETRADEADVVRE